MSDRKLYHFRQNNSGGEFRGPQHVIIEAATPQDANRIARVFGVYFEDRGDCIECCGYRWYEVEDQDVVTALEVGVMLEESRSILLVKGAI